MPCEHDIKRRCRECHRAKKREEYARNRDTILDKRKETYRQSADVRAAAAQQARRYYEENRDRVLQRVSDKYHSDEARREQIKAKERLRHHDPEVTQKRHERLGRVFPEGVTVTSLREKQSFRCAVCQDPLPKDAHVDHDHRTGLVRGLLCRGCNTGIGFLKDDPKVLEAAFSYLLQPPALAECA